MGLIYHGANCVARWIIIGLKEIKGHALGEKKERCKAFISVSPFCHTYSKVKQRQHYRGKLKGWKRLLFWYSQYQLFQIIVVVVFPYLMKMHTNLKGNGVSHNINSMSLCFFPARIVNNGLAFMS